MDYKAANNLCATVFIKLIYDNCFVNEIMNVYLGDKLETFF